MSIVIDTDIGIQNAFVSLTFCWHIKFLIKWDKNLAELGLKWWVVSVEISTPRARAMLIVRP